MNHNASTPRLLLYISLLAALTAASACGGPSGPREEPLQLFPELDARDTRSVVPPPTTSDAVRLPYAVPADLDGRGERGVLEAGSPVAFSILRALHAGELDAPLPRHEAPMAEGLDLRAWRGEDGVAYTVDDRPFVSLADLNERLAPSDTSLGWLVWRARRSPHALPDSPWRWHALEGHAMNSDDAATLIDKANRCSAEALHDRFGLPARSTHALVGRRPVVTVDDLRRLPWLGRRHVVLWSHLANHQPCPASSSETGTTDPLAAELAQSPTLLRLRWLYTPDHFQEVHRDIARNLDASVRELRARGYTGDDLDLMARDTLRRRVRDRLRRPFEHLRPATPERQDPDHLRAVAGEHLLHWFSTADLSPTPLTQSYRDLVDQHADTFISELAGLRSGHATWDVFHDGDVQIFVGRVFGLYCEVAIDRRALVVGDIYVEFD